MYNFILYKFNVQTENGFKLSSGPKKYPPCHVVTKLKLSELDFQWQTYFLGYILLSINNHWSTSTSIRTKSAQCTAFSNLFLFWVCNLGGSITTLFIYIINHVAPRGKTSKLSLQLQTLQPVATPSMNPLLTSLSTLQGIWKWHTEGKWHQHCFFPQRSRCPLVRW